MTAENERRKAPVGADANQVKRMKGKPMITELLTETQAPSTYQCRACGHANTTENTYLQANRSLVPSLSAAEYNDGKPFAPARWIITPLCRDVSQCLSRIEADRWTQAVAPKEVL